MHVPPAVRLGRTSSSTESVLDEAIGVEEEPTSEEEAVPLEYDEDSSDEVYEEAFHGDSYSEPDESEEFDSDEQDNLETDDDDAESPISGAVYDVDAGEEIAEDENLLAGLDAGAEPDVDNGDTYSTEQDPRLSLQRQPVVDERLSSEVEQKSRADTSHARAYVEERSPDTVDAEPSPANPSHPTQPRRSRTFGSPSIPRKFSRRTPCTTYIREAVSRQRSANGNLPQSLIHVKRRYCPLGKKYYRCANGFTGCCGVNPCNVGSTCPDSEGDGDAAETSEVATGRATGVGGLRSTTATRTVVVTGSRSATGRILTASLTHSKQANSSATTTPTTPAVPSCPADDGKTYTDYSKIEYRVRCSANNTYATDSTIEVGTGGYAQCFSACSHSKSCAGFTYVGTSSGTCYLKSAMPSGSYVSQTWGADYVSCEKTDPNAAAPDVTDAATTDKGGMSRGAKIGAIIGGVLGGILLIILILLIIACLAKRHRKKIERKRATITHVIQGPIETTQPLNPGGHLRQGSTGHDVFQPFGGFYQGWSKASPQTSIIIQPPPNDEWQSQTAPSLRAEGGPMLPATTYRPPDRGYRQDVINTGVMSNVSSPPGYKQDPTTLYSSAIARPSSQRSSSRSPRFREHLDDSGGYFAASSPYTTSADSPTLGRPHKPLASPSLADQVRRQRHLNGVVQNDVSGTPPKVRTPSPVSPLTMDVTIGKDFAVSPLFSRHQDRF